jgi:acylphosphatase
MSETTDQRVRRRIVFTGHVQGVGFRYTTTQTAVDYPVTGYVRNQPDGSVEVVAEGAASAIDQFERRIRQRMEGYIGDSTSEEASATGEFDSFEVRF